MKRERGKTDFGFQFYYPAAEGPLVRHAVTCHSFRGYRRSPSVQCQDTVVLIRSRLFCCYKNVHSPQRYISSGQRILNPEVGLQGLPRSREADRKEGKGCKSEQQIELTEPWWPRKVMMRGRMGRSKCKAEDCLLQGRQKTSNLQTDQELAMGWWKPKCGLD